MRKITVLTAVICFLHCTLVRAQQVVFSGYAINDGLSQSVVNCIFQDSKGFMWFGTQNGLNKFNVYSFEVFTYNPNDSNSITNNWINGITEDKENNLWIATKGGLVKFSTREKRFNRIRYTTPYEGTADNCIYDVKCTRNGNIFINMPPILSVCNPKTLKFQHFISPTAFDGSAKDNNIPLLEDSKGIIWMATTKGLVSFDPGTSTFKIYKHDASDPASLSNNNISALYQDGKGELWIGTYDGLNHRKTSGGGYDHYYHEPQNKFSLSNNLIRAIISDPSGKLWIATEGGGLNRMNTDKSKKTVFEHFSAENNGLNHNINLSLFIDHSDNLWIGTLSGINKTDLKKRNFNLYRKSDSPNALNLAGNVIASVFEDEAGIVWIGNWGQGLNLFDRTTNSVEHYSTRLQGKHHLPNDYIHCIFEDDKDLIWLGTRDGLLIYNRQEKRFLRPSTFFKTTSIPAFNGLRINRMIQDHEKNYWIATHDGLYKISHQGLPMVHFSADAVPGLRISSNLVYAVIEDQSGNIWVGTINGLDCINTKKGSITHFRKHENSRNSLSDNFITALCEDQQGNIWIGTNSYLNVYNKRNGTFRFYGAEAGFPSNLVYSICEDNQHQLWFATGNGLCRFDAASGTYRNYTVEDGLQSPEFNMGAFYKSAGGEMFFGGMNGLNSFYPDSLVDNPHIPVIAFTSAFKINKGKREPLNIADEGSISLPYSENTFNVEFAALEFTNPSRNNYAYRLEGVDDDWNYIGTRNFVAFTNLAPGEYQLHVKGSNNNGRWNEPGVSLPIVIYPPWWRTKAAVAVYLFLSVLLVILYIKIRERNHVRERKILEERVKVRTQLIEEQKSEIEQKNTELNQLNEAKDNFFSIIAHDLRNPFNAIIGLTDILLMNLGELDATRLKKSLENIKGSSQQAYELLENLLLWARTQTGTIAFRPVSINITEQAESCIELLAVQAARKNIKLTTEGNTSTWILGDANMMNTIIRNLITNALKFTPANGEVKVGISKNDGYCMITVKDNGIGIPDEKLKKLFSIETAHKTKGTDGEPGTGLGLILCKEFVAKHNGHIDVISEVGNGSEFRVVIPANEPASV